MTSATKCIQSGMSTCRLFFARCFPAVLSTHQALTGTISCQFSLSVPDWNAAFWKAAQIHSQFKLLCIQGEQQPAANRKWATVRRRRSAAAAADGARAKTITLTPPTPPLKMIYQKRSLRCKSSKSRIYSEKAQVKASMYLEKFRPRWTSLSAIQYLLVLKTGKHLSLIVVIVISEHGGSWSLLSCGRIWIVILRPFVSGKENCLLFLCFFNDLYHKYLCYHLFKLVNARL